MLTIRVPFSKYMNAYDAAMEFLLGVPFTVHNPGAENHGMVVSPYELAFNDPQPVEFRVVSKSGQLVNNIVLEKDDILKALVGVDV